MTNQELKNLKQQSRCPICGMIPIVEKRNPIALADHLFWAHDIGRFGETDNLKTFDEVIAWMNKALLGVKP